MFISSYSIFSYISSSWENLLITKKDNFADKHNFIQDTNRSSHFA